MLCPRAQELWRKLGDDEVRKVAYRGRCLTPARTSTRERYPMNEDNSIVRLRQSDEIDDPLTALLRSGARRLLEQAIEAEVAAFLASMRDLKLPDGRDRLVRHGHGPERVIQTGIGPVEVQRVTVRDRTAGPAGERIRFSSALLPRWGACQSLGDAQTAMARAGTWLSLAAMAGYQVVNRSRSVPSRALVRVCRSRWAPCFDHCICCFLAKRRLTTRLTVDSANAVEIRSPLNQRSL